MSLLIPKGDTLVTYYILPILGLNRKSFGRPFKTSLISGDGLKVYVHLRRRMLSPTYKSNPYYITEILLGKELYVIFTIPSTAIGDSKKFLGGKYSHMSKETKKLIYNGSTLPYNKTSGSFKMSHPILQALDRTKFLRAHLEEVLGFEEIPETAELIDPPSAHPEWFIESRTIKI